jgi:hypothetical protein
MKKKREDYWNDPDYQLNEIKKILSANSQLREDIFHLLKARDAKKRVFGTPDPYEETQEEMTETPAEDFNDPGDYQEPYPGSLN